MRTYHFALRDHAYLFPWRVNVEPERVSNRATGDRLGLLLCVVSVRNDSRNIVVKKGSPSAVAFVSSIQKLIGIFKAVLESLLPRSAFVYGRVAECEVGYLPFELASFSP